MYTQPERSKAVDGSVFSSLDCADTPLKCFSAGDLPVIGRAIACLSWSNMAVLLLLVMEARLALDQLTDVLLTTQIGN